MSGERDCYYRFDGGTHSRLAERKTRRVVMLTTAMMLIEIAGGTLFGSMALLADGWHMATHVVALGMAAFAYHYARKHADSTVYTFGTGKIGVLAGFASGMALTIIALIMVMESATRLFKPTTIAFEEAIAIAVIGLGVNLLSAWWLRDTDDHHAHDAQHAVHAHDHNLRAAYLHVLADALTSVLAIAALVGGIWLGWVWLDAIIGIVCALVIGRWCYGLLRDTAEILLDRCGDEAVVNAIRKVAEINQHDRIEDLHVWHIAPNQLAAIVEIATDTPQPPMHYRKLLADVPSLVHVTVQVNQQPQS